MIEKIVSGGQSGVDRAALDAAIENDIPHGGWCPAGRKTEDGVLSKDYRLAETPSGDYIQRTEWNVRDSDGTLILNRGSLEGGTALTVDYAQSYNKPYRIVDLDEPLDITAILDWLSENAIRTLNVAGPRESKQPGIEDLARRVLQALIDAGFRG